MNFLFSSKKIIKVIRRFVNFFVNASISRPILRPVPDGCIRGQRGSGPIISDPGPIFFNVSSKSYTVQFKLFTNLFCALSFKLVLA